MGDDRKVAAFAFDVGNAEGHDKITIGGIGHFAGIAVEQGVFHHIDWVVVANRGFQQAFGIGGRAAGNDFDAGNGITSTPVENPEPKLDVSGS